MALNRHLGGRGGSRGSHWESPWNPYAPVCPPYAPICVHVRLKTGSDIGLLRLLLILDSIDIHQQHQHEPLGMFGYGTSLRVFPRIGCFLE